MITDETRKALADEARIKILEVKIAKLQGKAEASSSLAYLLSTQSNDAQTMIQESQQELNALKAGAGPGVTDDFGQRSIVDNAAAAERNAGQTAAITAIKTNPEIALDEVKTIWNNAALTSRPANRQWLLNNTDNLLQEYYANLVAVGAITEATWEAFRAWIVATPVEVIQAPQPQA